jgi:lipoprotein-anchoring transpeptidase ErfK/SrfK
MKIEAINRRDFLKYSALFSASAWMAGSRASSKFALSRPSEANANKLGRVLFDDVVVYDQPSQDSPVQKTLMFNDLVEYSSQQTVNNGYPHQDMWCRLSDSSYTLYKNLQPVENQLSEPVLDIPTSGQLAEVCVPFTTAVVDEWNQNQREKEDQMFFYGSTHWIYGLGKDEAGIYYYQVREDRWDDSYYVNATHMRLIADNELTPTSTAVDQTEKVIRINLEEQYLVAYENEQPIFISALSSGQLTGDADLTTPQGNFEVNYKRPSRHMVHTDRISINDNELYGVPWVSYFTDSGIAFHGTYWHNDFNQPNSHGCINLPIPAARWIYRWTQPVVPPREKKYVSNSGTRVEVF